jgi:hypothetical protein
LREELPLTATTAAPKVGAAKFEGIGPGPRAELIRHARGELREASERDDD